jgi:hypothetical protein
MDHLARLIDPITQFLGTDFGSNILRALGSAAAAVATLFAIALTVRNSGRRWWNFFRRRLRDDLKVVDAILTDRDSGVYEIDIKLRNLGSQPIVIRQIALQIHEALQLECTGGAVSKLVVTETYCWTQLMCLDLSRYPHLKSSNPIKLTVFFSSSTP